MFANSKPFSSQLALFVKSGTIRADELSFAATNMNIGEFEPILIPEVPGMPDEFPKLQINTPAGYRLTMSKMRIDFFMELPLGLDESDLVSFERNCDQLLDILAGKNIIYSRVGFVRSSFARGVQAPQLVEMLSKIPPAGVSDFFVSYTQKIECIGRVCNDVRNFSNGMNASGEAGVGSVRDINTDPAHEIVMSADDVKAFVVSCTNLFVSQGDLVEGL